MFATAFETFQRPLSLRGVGDRRSSELPARRLRRMHDRAAWARQGLAADRLFFAVLPDPDTAARIADLAGRLRDHHGLAGKVLKPEHFHVTLFHVGDGVGLPPDVVDVVSERSACLSMPAFRVAFDRVGSFRNGAFVLRGDDGTIGLEVLHQRLSDALDGRPRPARPFTPHLTLLRDNQHVAEHPITPIAWTVREVVLVHSLLGRTAHRHIARLPLASA